ncbi:MAG TPA: family 1 glycosylhydrolase [Pyrinomonadaceae bacterium]|jgi:dTDP-4-dehydrorhamnose reductase
MHTKPSLASSLELWAGVECSITRVRDRFYDQLERQGHYARGSDLEEFARLGIRALRYPVLWEKTAPGSIEDADWSWAEERLTRLRQLGVRPIVGLVHHGSGPLHTSLVDDEFPEKLAAYARAVAEKFPWVEDYTPVNEPLTTARFSGLYGHWYPHGTDDATFTRALLNECRGVLLAMRAIRCVNPRARLVQTEDLGKTYSTVKLSYQAEFENERRWLSFDLLSGRVTREHPLRSYLLSSGIQERELEWFLENASRPDSLGINHYLTSERFLDDRVARYPHRLHGGNGRHVYADVEAVRVLAEGVAGPRALMKEAWERYGVPIVVTEAHLGCTREEQLRWLKEIWEGALSLRQEGVDVRAVTAWALLGSFDWNSLMTRPCGFYEPGVFDIRSGEKPRPTALARMLSEVARGAEQSSPVLDTPGWWRRLDRLQFPPFHHRRQDVAKTVRGVSMKGLQSRPVLITGATGTLGRATARICEIRGLSYRLLTRREMDIASPESVENALREYEPWAIMNTAGYVRVDDAEREPERCFRENAHGPKVLAEACSRHGVRLVTFSSDLVFDGSKGAPYSESDEPRPLNVYGRSKLLAEREALGLNPSALIIRTSAFFGPWDEYNFLTAALRALSLEQRFAAAQDMIVSPAYVPELVNATLDLLIDGEKGIWHLANAGAVSWADFARSAATQAGLDAGLIEDCPARSFNYAAPRPGFSALTSERGLMLSSLEEAVARYVRECEVSWTAAARREPETKTVASVAAASAGAK